VCAAGSNLANSSIQRETQSNSSANITLPLRLSSLPVQHRAPPFVRLQPADKVSVAGIAMSVAGIAIAVGAVRVRTRKRNITAVLHWRKTLKAMFT
jgi:hypothetical protein